MRKGAMRMRHSSQRPSGHIRARWRIWPRDLAHGRKSGEPVTVLRKYSKPIGMNCSWFVNWKTILNKNICLMRLCQAYARKIWYLGGISFLPICGTEQACEWEVWMRLRMHFYENPPRLRIFRAYDGIVVLNRYRDFKLLFNWRIDYNSCLLVYCTFEVL